MRNEKNKAGTKLKQKQMPKILNAERSTSTIHRIVA
jgi:hypothetical protein